MSVRLTGDLAGFVAERRDEPVPDHCDSAWQVFAHLASLPDAAARPSWLRFLERLAQTAPLPADPRKRLRALIWPL